MSMLFNLLWRSGSGWSVLISLAVVAIIGLMVWILLKSLYSRKRFSPLGMVVGSITLILLFVQFVPAITAYNLNGTVTEILHTPNLLEINGLMGGYFQRIVA